MRCLDLARRRLLALTKAQLWRFPIGVITMDDQEKSEKTQAQILRDVFEGMRGRQPKSDQELNEWLATDEGKEATIFESAAVSRWGEIGRS